VDWCFTRRKQKSFTARIPNRKGRYPTVQFDFLGYTFQPRFTAWPNGTYGVSFLPAASHGALKAMRREVRRWGLQNRTDTALHDWPG
jgi:RNA-directed DNA polymerase